MFQKDKRNVLEFMHPEMVLAGVKGDDPGLSTAAAATSQGKRKSSVEAGSQAQIDSSASLTESVASCAHLEELIALSTTLKNALNAGPPSGIVLTSKTRVENSLQSSVGLESPEPAEEPERVAPVDGGSVVETFLRAP